MTGLPELQRGDKNGGYPQLSRKFVARRISEGETGRLKEQLKCQACGKGYKHVSSLAKHLWEHTPEWSVTSKLLISKHQQVQLLEAASILVSMNEEDETETVSNENNNENDNNENSNEINNNNENSQTVNSQPVNSQPVKINNEANPANHLANHTPHHPAHHPANKIPEELETAVEDVLSPARDIPVLGGRPIAKPARNRRYSQHAGHPSSFTGSNGHAGSFTGSYGHPGSFAGSYGHAGSFAGSFGQLDGLRQASPLPEAMLAASARRRRPSALAPPVLASRRGYEEEDDGLQDPEEELDMPRTPKHSPQPRKPSPKKEEVFGLEV